MCSNDEGDMGAVSTRPKVSLGTFHTYPATIRYNQEPWARYRPRYTFSTSFQSPLSLTTHIGTDFNAFDLRLKSVRAKVLSQSTSCSKL